MISRTWIACAYSLCTATIVLLACFGCNAEHDEQDIGSRSAKGSECSGTGEASYDKTSTVAGAEGGKVADDLDRSTDRPSKDSAEGYARSCQQWPQDAEARAGAMRQRLTRVERAINTSSGGNVNVLLGQTNRGGAATGKGIIFVDITMLWRLSEDALAVLVAHECGHEMLGHAEELGELLQKDSRQSTRLHRLRELERQADEFAGRVLACTDYDARGFGELLSLTRDTEWADPIVRQYYSNHARLKTFLESYEAEQRVEDSASLQEPEMATKG